MLILFIKRQKNQARMFLKETWTWTGHPARIHSLSTNYSQGKGSWRKRASVGTTRFVEGPGGMVLRRKALLFSEKRKRYLTDKIIGFLYRCSSYLPIHLPSFFFFLSGFVQYILHCSHFLFLCLASELKLDLSFLCLCLSPCQQCFVYNRSLTHIFFIDKECNQSNLMDSKFL